MRNIYTNTISIKQLNFKHINAEEKQIMDLKQDERRKS